MSSPLRTIRAFSAELMKIAADIKDGDIQKMLADRNGEEYLPGGKLPTNTLEEENSGRQAKTAGFDHVGLAASGNHDLSSKKKKKNVYQKSRDYGTAAVKGGLTGLGIVGGINAMRGRFGAPDGAVAIRHAARAAQRAAAAGAGFAVADRAYRHDDIPGMDKKAGLVNPSAGRSFGTPASALATSRRTGGFKSGVVHRSGQPPKILQLGKKFHLP